MNDSKHEQVKSKKIVKVNYIAQLPEELLVEIFQYLGWVDIVAVRGVCRLWRRVGSDPIELRRRTLADAQLMTFLKRERRRLIAALPKDESEVADGSNSAESVIEQEGGVMIAEVGGNAEETDVVGSSSSEHVVDEEALRTIVEVMANNGPVQILDYFEHRQRVEQTIQQAQQTLDVRSSVAGSLRNMAIFFAGFMIFMFAVAGLTVISSPERRNSRHSVLIGLVIDFGVTALIFMGCCLARCLRNRTQRALRMSQAEQGRLDESSPLLAVRLVVNDDDEDHVETEQQAVVGGDMGDFSNQ